MFEVLNNWVATQLSGSAGPSSFVFLFLGGVLASLLPCVYPLYPITVSILRARHSSLGRAAHPVAYYLGLASAYAGLGLVAASTGGAANEVMRLPGVNVGIGVLLLFMALATVGLLEFPVLPTSQVGAREQHLGGTALMGAAAGILSSACVGPVVVGILVALAAHAGPLSVATIVGAAAKMFVFGLGVGVPVIILGVFGLRLPKSGRWMLVTQWLFAGLIAYFALGYIYKGLTTWGLAEPQARLLLVGAGLLAGATFFVQSPEKAAAERTRTALAVLAGVIGFSLISHALPSGRVERGQVVAQGLQASTVETHGDLTWFLDASAAYAEAKRTGKPVFIDFYGTWCTNCKAFEDLTLADEAFHRALQQAVLLKVYDTSATFAEYRDDPRFPELRVGLPFFVVTGADGSLLYKTTDYTKTDEMSLFL